MTPLPANTPILIGAGQASERPADAHYQRLSPTDLAAAAADQACRDAGAASTLSAHIDAIVAVRTLADSVLPQRRLLVAPFGSPNNVPGAIARRLGCTPATLIYSPSCGDEPQRLVGEACERLHRGEWRMALLCGGEATSTVRAAQAAGLALDWSEQIDGEFEDRRSHLEMHRSPAMIDHQMNRPVNVYPLFEQARRRRLGATREDYARRMGELLAPFSRVAAANPHAASRKLWSAQAIAQIGQAPTGSNRMVADPHPISVVARDQVNQGAALLLSTVGLALQLGIPEARWVYLHGYSALEERPVLERQDLGTSAAMAAAYRQALACARASIGDIRHIDIYSCFPIAMFSACEALGLAPDDPRGLTLTGGLPYFGGPGNNYSMHAIAELVQRLRADPGRLGLVGANGGLMSTHAVGVYSSTPRAFEPCDSGAAQASMDALPAPAINPQPQGAATVESYTVLHNKAGATDVLLVGRLQSSGERFVATQAPGDDAAVLAFSHTQTALDPLLHRLQVRSDRGRNTFTLAG